MLLNINFTIIEVLEMLMELKYLQTFKTTI